VGRGRRGVKPSGVESLTGKDEILNWCTKTGVGKDWFSSQEGGIYFLGGEAVFFDCKAKVGRNSWSASREKGRGVVTNRWFPKTRFGGRAGEK